VAEWIFWGSLLLLLYPYVGYPLCLAAFAAVTKPGRDTPPSQAPACSVSIIIAAHNEARHIAQKLHVLLNQDYSAGALEIIVASDGSSDDTVMLARAINDPRIRVLDLPRQGKIATLNAALVQARHDILVFTDADNQWANDTLSKLLAPLADIRIGACAGNMTIPDPGQGLSLGDSLYRRYEAWLRKAENRAGCVVSADGALLALRRELVQKIPEHVTDDFFLSTCAPSAGRRIAYVPDARVLDRGVDAYDKQLRRRQRLTVRALHSLSVRRPLMNPLRHGFYAVALISHKVLRRLVPLLLAPILVSNFFLWQQADFYRYALAAQLLAYGVGVIGLFDTRARLPKPFRLAGFLLVTLIGLSSGLWLFLRGHRYALWNPQQNR